MTARAVRIASSNLIVRLHATANQQLARNAPYRNALRVLSAVAVPGVLKTIIHGKPNAIGITARAVLSAALRKRSLTSYSSSPTTLEPETSLDTGVTTTTASSICPTFTTWSTKVQRLRTHTLPLCVLLLVTFFSRATTNTEDDFLGDRGT
mmetsp:Transcript_20145/g.29897  ORF Transcript_20145/g.29897 Transcript_20145/m.29897 type:complete len:151 (+) Transcript_20145:3-455(+)